MKFCTNCGTRMEDKAAFCPNCGAPQSKDKDAYEPLGYDRQQYQPQQYQPQQYQAPQYQAPQYQNQQYQYLEPYPTGGRMALSIVTALFCLIPGIVAINKTRSINNCATYEEQMQTVKSVKIWCAVGLVIGILALVARLAQAY